MRVLFDTNVFIDIITKRGEFYEDSNNALCLARLRKMKIMISTVSVADLMYITRKSFSDSKTQREKIKSFVKTIKLVTVKPKDFSKAFDSPMKDFEDAVQAHCAKRNFASMIVTRNDKHFSSSPIRAITPEDFLEMFK